MSSSSSQHSSQAAFKIPDACAYLGGLSAITIRRLIQRGELKRHPAFRHVVITKRELDRFLAKGEQCLN